MTTQTPMMAGHEPGCPVLTAAGNPQCTCSLTGKTILQLQRDLAAAQEALEQERSRVEYPAKEIGELLAQLKEAQEARQRAEALAEQNAKDAALWKRLEGALRWYADPANYYRAFIGAPPIMHDCGDRAREALK